MKTKYFFLAAAAALFAACSSDDGIAEQQQAKQQAEQVPVNFGAYVNRGTTRAGQAGELTNDQLKWGTHLDDGFGVFCYYTDNQYYSETSKPNFMYNQQVKFVNGDFLYEPVKYWPNEYGDKAQSEGIDRLSFFAYAPWVPVTAKTGIVTGDAKSGIVALTNNTKSGDPYVKYFVDMDPAKQVDLCWGVAAAAYTDVVEGDADFTVGAGDLFLDLTKPKTDSKIKFNFLHALASLNVTIDTDVDVKSHATSALASGTKIYVRSVSFDGFATKGMLNLNSKTADWYDLTGINKIVGNTFTVFDGRRDGKEGQTGAEAANEIPSGLNENIIQKNTATNGVTNTAVNLFNSTTANAPVYVIPTGTALTVTIVYDVETSDDNVAGFLSDGKTHGSTVENKITKTITLSSSGNMTLAAGKKYTVNLHLGMTSVKFDAEVTGWGDAIEGGADLPINDN